MRKNTTPNELNLSCDVIGAELTLNGLLTISTKLEEEDFVFANDLLGEAIWGSNEDGVELPMPVALMRDDETGEELLAMNHFSEEPGKDTYLQLHLALPEPYTHVPSVAGFSQKQLTDTWHRGKEKLAREEAEWVSRAKKMPFDRELAIKAKTASLVRVVLQYVAGDAPEVSPVAIFEEWQEITGRAGQVGVIQRLQQAA
ncbi:hypothetical protein AMC99_01827 [Altererythrobacter epoxidivorans]|uniref:Uncharacterized protein n=1 Tax=Altererythrobacter epoxidivorans TaxID=361183 RepID=A0A0M4M572_9SPHN|nr:hypothetical protein [Altererythrobacter epoxidivorans]ALE17115.1 hypothetical protein AMC99_01827 [Altererythrobacter epoxidivorans]